MHLYTHPQCLLHDPGAGHPEAPARLREVLAAIEAARLPGLAWHQAPAATRRQLLRVHEPQLLHRILDLPVDGLRRLDPDTVMSQGSAGAALHAAGAVCAAVDAVLLGQASRAFCAVRPPGHHATRSEAMGFCLFNSIAVGAAQALEEHGLQRVAIVDFDVHHGNGTADIFRDDARVLYLSSHQESLFPGTGSSSERGVGNLWHAPLPEGTDSRAFRQEWRARLLPALESFRPQLVMVSAGFDGHGLDPLAGLDLVGADYAWLTQVLLDSALAHAHGRIVSALEGGYSLTALRECSVAHLRVLAEAPAPA